MKTPRYTINNLHQQFPDDDTCLDYIFQQRFSGMIACPKCGVVEPKYYRVRSKKVYECKDCGNQISPLANTIFHKSETSLTKWFYAMYMFSVSRNGVSGKELERTLGVTYKTAWRMCKQIRLMMQQSDQPLTGIVEIDETYMGGTRRKIHQKSQWDNKTAVIGMVEKKKGEGRITAITTKQANATVVLPFIRAMARQDTEIQTDESRIYHRVKREYAHRFINHSKEEYSVNGISTNTIEGFWSQMKRSIDGTYHCVSPKYLQLYVNEFVFRYNVRQDAVYPHLLAKAGLRVQ
jgi:transposase